jgi:hypothetical protein
MINRRGWLVAAGTVAAGLFALPAQALAGFLGRRRGKPVPPCCPAAPPGCEEVPYTSTIRIQNPPDWGHVQQSFSANGYFSPSYGGPCIKCVVSHPNGGTYPSDPELATISGTTWSCSFKNVPSTNGQWASLYATLYDATCTTVLASDMHRIQIG